MRLFLIRILLLLCLCLPSLAESLPYFPSTQQPLGPFRPPTISASLFASLERLARLVDISYCVGTAGILPPFTCPSRCADFPTLHLAQTWNTGPLLSDSCGYIAVDHDASNPEIVVAFRGTYSLTNTVIDLSSVPQEYVPYPASHHGNSLPRCANCTVHMGFWASWCAARRVVLPALRALRNKNPNHRVHLVGHSLGGAVAALAALELRLSMGWKDVAVTTFGEPKLGNAGLARYVDEAFGLLDGEEEGQESTYRRVTHVGDPVPLLPLGEWGYRPHAGEVFITKEGLQPGVEDVRLCKGDKDQECLEGEEATYEKWERWRDYLRERGEDQIQTHHGVTVVLEIRGSVESGIKPERFRIRQLLFAHRDYFWRLGLCVPGGDPWNWGRSPYNGPPSADEL